MTSESLNPTLKQLLTDSEIGIYLYWSKYILKIELYKIITNRICTLMQHFIMELKSVMSIKALNFNL